MKESEAIKYFKGFLEYDKKYEDCKLPTTEPYTVAIEALEKQIPKKAIITGHNNAINTDIGNCPCCDNRCLRACDFTYCPDCGQKLDWK